MLSRPDKCCGVCWVLEDTALRRHLAHLCKRRAFLDEHAICCVRWVEPAVPWADRFYLDRDFPAVELSHSLVCPCGTNKETPGRACGGVKRDRIPWAARGSVARMWASLKTPERDVDSSAASGKPSWVGLEMFLFP